MGAVWAASGKRGGKTVVAAYVLAQGTDQYGGKVNLDWVVQIAKTTPNTAIFGGTEYARTAPTAC